MAPATDSADERAREERVDVSVVVPCHGCAQTLPALVDGVGACLSPRGWSVEFVLVADDSADDARAIDALAVADRRVRAVFLRERSGQHGAIAAGLRVARGDVVVVMDGDLQHRPVDVPLLVDALVDHDVAVARRLSRSEGIIVRASSTAFFWLLSAVVGARLDPGLSSFSALRRHVVDALPHACAGPRHHLLEARRTDANVAIVPAAFPPRRGGRSAYSVTRRVALAVDLLLVARPSLARFAVPLAVGSAVAVGCATTMTTLFAVVLAPLAIGACAVAWRSRAARNRAAVGAPSSLPQG